MSESPEKGSQADNEPQVDLSQLQGLSFGPDWSNRSSSSTPKKGREKRDSGGSKGGAVRRDRRPPKPARREGGDGDFSSRRPDSRRPREGRGGPSAGRGGDRRGAPPIFRPTVEVLFYPEDLPFKALSQAIRRYCKTYELFEIAKLILEKAERYVVVIKPRNRPGEEPKSFYISVPDGAPFESESDALGHVLKNHIDQFFTIEEKEVEPPKGSFASVNKCGITGELLGPPNYHRYQALLQEHHATRLGNMPFARFESKIESIKETEVIEEWVQKMTKVMRYTVKDPTLENPPSFDTLESAKNYLLAHCRDKIVAVKDQARLSGRLVETLPDGPIRKSIETVLEAQRRFPLDTANNLRGRLRRMKFTIYKRGAKGVSYVCSVKRKFRDEKTSFAEDIANLIAFIEKKPNILVSELPKAYLGIETHEELPVQTPVETAPNMEAVEAETPAAEATPAASPTEAAPAPEATTPPADDAKPAEESSAEAPKADAPAESAPAEAAESAEPAVKKVEPIVSEVVTSKALSAEDEAKVRSMMMSLQWLVHEGYVTEYGDGRLFAPAPMVTPKPKEEGDAAAKTETTPEPESSPEGAAAAESAAPAETAVAETAPEQNLSEPKPESENQKVASEETSPPAEDAPAAPSETVPTEPSPETSPESNEEPASVSESAASEKKEDEAKA